ncbi:MAG: hypothetical protein DI535_25710 [Citrobacter freundii]|nr:MAG: hypothetical protein DI535_25710 [Citrobacter freundii]
MKGKIIDVGYKSKLQGLPLWLLREDSSLRGLGGFISLTGLLSFIGWLRTRHLGFEVESLKGDFSGNALIGHLYVFGCLQLKTLNPKM